MKLGFSGANQYNIYIYRTASQTLSRTQGSRCQPPSLLQLTQPESWNQLNRDIQQRLQSTHSHQIQQPTIVTDGGESGDTTTVTSARIIRDSIPEVNHHSFCHVYKHIIIASHIRYKTQLLEMAKGCKYHCL